MKLITKRTHDLRRFHKVCYRPISALTLSKPNFKLSDNDLSKFYEDSRLLVLGSLTSLDLSILVASKFLKESAMDQFNFEMVRASFPFRRTLLSRTFPSRFPFALAYPILTALNSYFTLMKRW